MLNSMHRTCLLLSLIIGCASLATGCRKKGQGTGGARADGAPYDVKPLLTLLRPAEQKRLAGKLGLRSLGELPFYDMDLALDTGGARLAGGLTLHYPNRTGKPLAALPLLLHPNAPAELGAKQASELKLVKVTDGDGKVLKVVTVRPTLSRVVLPAPVAPGRWLKVRVVFEGRIRRLPQSSNDIFAQALSSLGVGAGTGASDYGLLAVGDGIATVASAYPVVPPFSAREGKFDTEPPSAFGDLAYNDLINFRVRTTVPKGQTIVTNLVELPRVERIGDGQPVYTSVGAATRDLVLVAGADLTRASRQVGSIRVTSVFLKGDRQGGVRMLETTAGALALYQERFGSYPYTELDVAEATLVGGAGGVEFPGMVLVAGMFYRKPSRSQNPLAMLTRLMGRLGGALGGTSGGGTGGARGGGTQRMDRMVDRMGRFVTAHEIAHQYFAGLVGSDCRRHPSVDEPLAQFAAAEYMRSYLGERRSRRLIAMNIKANYGIYRMLGGEDMPAAQPLSNFPSALAYAALVYGKAPYFYFALRRKLGPERFNRALRRAVDENRFRLITLDQWIASLRRGAGGDPAVEKLARRYFKESHGDEDLGMDGSGDAVLELMMGKATMAQLRQGMAFLGMKPADLFRMLMGKMAGGAGAATRQIDPMGSLKQLEKMQRMLER
jgi:hypothetical protein